VECRCVGGPAGGKSEIEPEREAAMPDHETLTKEAADVLAYAFTEVFFEQFNPACMGCQLTLALHEEQTGVQPPLQIETIYDGASLCFVLHMSRFFGNLVGVSGVPLLSDDWVGLQKLYNDHHLHWQYVFTATTLEEAFVERVPLLHIFRDALTEFMSP
jgi:hypothetical protein